MQKVRQLVGSQLTVGNFTTFGTTLVVNAKKHFKLPIIKLKVFSS